MYLIKIVMETLEYICVAPSSTTCTLSLLEFVKKIDGDAGEFQQCDLDEPAVKNMVVSGLSCLSGREDGLDRR